MRINNNLMAMNAHRQLGVVSNAGTKSMERLSSGFRINRAGDDAAGLAISEKMRGQIRGLTQASRNAQDGISLIQTAEGALQETHAILQRMRELAVQASTDTNTADDRLEIQKEMNELIDEIDRIATQTQFNEQELLNGEFTERVFHIGANTGQNIKLSIAAMGSGAPAVGTTGEAAKVDGITGDTTKITGVAIDADSDYAGEYTLTISYETDKAVATLKDSEDVTVGSVDVTEVELRIGDITFSIDSSDVPEESDPDLTITFTATAAVPATQGEPGTGGLGVGDLKIENPDVSSTGGIMEQDKASEAITTIQNAIQTVSAERSKLGAYQNRLEHTIKNLETSAENLQASEARIRDVDYTEAA